MDDGNRFSLIIFIYVLTDGSSSVSLVVSPLTVLYSCILIQLCGSNIYKKDRWGEKPARQQTTLGGLQLNIKYYRYVKYVIM